MDETRIWSEWADWLGVPRLTFLATLGGAIARGGDHREVFELFRPGLDFAAAWQARLEQGEAPSFLPVDFYADAVPCLATLEAAGYQIGIVGNQPAGVESALRSLGIPLALVATSETWGVRKPDPAFFARVLDEVGLPPGEVAYVGDRLDNDVRPAAAAGLCAVWVRRGPWAWIQAGRVTPPEAWLTVESLEALPGELARMAAEEGWQG